MPQTTDSFDLRKIEGSQVPRPQKHGPAADDNTPTAAEPAGREVTPSSTSDRNCKRAVDDDLMIRQGLQTCRDMAPVKTQIFDDGATRIHIKGPGFKVRKGL